MAEWTSQASLEEHWHLPLSVKPSACPLGQVQGQIFFVTTFAKPLMNITARVIPGEYGSPQFRSFILLLDVEMQKFADQCSINLIACQTEEAVLSGGSRHWEALYDSTFPPPSPRPPQDFLASFPLALPTFILGQHSGSQLTWQLPSPSQPPFPSIHGSLDGARVELLSPPESPAPSIGSFGLTTRSSCSSLRSTSSPSKNDATVAMRAAYQAGVRKKRSFYNRYSWTSDLSPIASSPDLSSTTIPKTTTLVTVAVSPVLSSPKPERGSTSHVMGTVQ